MNHDIFFRSVFAEPEQAASLIRFCLPPEEAKLLDLESLERLPDSYASPEGDEGRCDLLVRCPLKQGKASLLIAILVEHKSYPDPDAIAQMARYWANLILKSEGMPVIPILFYHGNDPFNPKPLRELYPWLPKELAQYQPDFPVLRIDLARRDITEILSAEGLSETARIGLLGLHAVLGGDEKVVRVVRALTERLPRLQGPRQIEMFRRTMVYLWDRSDSNLETFRSSMDRLPEAERPHLMTPAKQAIAEGFAQGEAAGRLLGLEQGIEQGIERGIEQGIERGIAQGLHLAHMQDARRMRAEGLSLELIAKVTGLAPEELNAL